MIFGHLLTSALRGLWRYRLPTALNLVALVLGLLGFLFVGSKIVEVRGADSLWPHADRIARLTQAQTPADTGIASPVTPAVSLELEKYLKAELPAIPAVARTRGMGTHPLLWNGKHAFTNIQAMDEDFSKIFVWPLREGNWSEALTHPRSIVLDPSVAQILFGAESPLGKTVTLNKTDLTVTGVLGEFPKQISLFDTNNGALVSRDVGDLLDYHKPDQPQNWLEAWTPTFVLLPPGWDAGQLSKALEGFGERHVPKELGAVHFGAVPLSQVIDLLENAFMHSNTTGVSFAAVLFFLGSLILLVACLNYANLAAAIGTARLREMALRKLLGERSLHILAQGMIESALLCCAAALLLLAILALAAPVLAGVPGMSDFRWLFRLAGFWRLAAIGMTTATVMGGLYPAILLARSQPLSIIKGGKEGSGSKRLFTALVALQFFAASFLLVAGLITHDQNSYMRSLYAPQNQDKVYSIRESEGRSLRAIRDSLAAVPGVLAVSGRTAPWPAQGGISLSRAREGSAHLQVFREGISQDFFTVIGSKFVAGRDFTPDRADDLAPPDDKKNGSIGTVVIDRSLAERLGWSPEAAIGQSLFEFGNGWTWQTTVIGVVEDRPIDHMSFDGSHGTIYQFEGDNVWFPLLRIARQNEADTAAAALAALNNLAPDRPIRLDSEESLYQGTDAQLNSIPQLFDWLTLFTFGIAIVGLAGMAMQVIGQRQHEIGIRKVLGAGDGTILRLLLTGFTRPVLIAALASWPFTYVVAKGYLSIFVKQERLTALPFIVSLGACLAVVASRRFAN